MSEFDFLTMDRNQEIDNPPLSPEEEAQSKNSDYNFLTMNREQEIQPSSTTLAPSSGASSEMSDLYKKLGIEPKEESWSFDFGKRLEKSVQESFGAVWGGLGMLADTVGMEKARDWSLNRSKYMFEKAAEKDVVEQKFGEIKNPLDFFQWGAERLIEFAPDMVLMAAGGAGLASSATKLAATQTMKTTLKTAAKKELMQSYKTFAKEYGKKEAMELAYKKTAGKIGSMMGMSAYEGFTGAGQAYLTDVDLRGVDEASPLKAVAAGVAMAGVTALNPLNKFLSKTLTGKAFSATGKEAIEMTLGEAVEEAAQESISVFHESGVDPNKTVKEAFSDPETYKRLVESGVAGALLGGTFGAPALHAGVKADRAEQARVKREETQKKLDSYDIPSVSREEATDKATKEAMYSRLGKEDQAQAMDDMEVATQAYEPTPPEPSRETELKRQETLTSQYEPKAPPTQKSPAELSAGVFLKAGETKAEDIIKTFEQATAEYENFTKEVEDYKQKWQEKNISLKDAKEEAGRLATKMSESFNKPFSAGQRANIQTYIMNRITNTRMDDKMGGAVTLSPEASKLPTKDKVQLKKLQKEGIKVRSDVVVKETGEVMEASVDAKEAVKDVQSRSEQMKKLMDCIGYSS